MSELLRDVAVAPPAEAARGMMRNPDDDSVARAVDAHAQTVAMGDRRSPSRPPRPLSAASEIERVMAIMTWSPQ